MNSDDIENEEEEEANDAGVDKDGDGRDEDETSGGEGTKDNETAKEIKVSEDEVVVDENHPEVRLSKQFVSMYANIYVGKGSNHRLLDAS